MSDDAVPSKPELGDQEAHLTQADKADPIVEVAIATGVAVRTTKGGVPVFGINASRATAILGGIRESRPERDS